MHQLENIHHHHHQQKTHDIHQSAEESIALAFYVTPLLAFVVLTTTLD